MSIFPVFHSLHSTHHWMLDYFLHLRFYFFAKHILSFLFLQEISKLLLEKHIPFDMRLPKLFMISPYWIVGQVDKFITNFLCIVVNCWETDIAFLIEPNSKRIKICDQHPLSDVEFSPQNNQRIFDVFLSDPLRLFAFYMVLDLD